MSNFNKHGTTYTPLNDPNASGNTYAAGINNAGTIVGYTGAGGGFILNGTTYTSFAFPGALYTCPLGINDEGEIVGEYEDTVGGYWQGFEANPVPIPASLLLLAPGLIGLAATRRRFKN